MLQNQPPRRSRAKKQKQKKTAKLHQDVDPIYFYLNFKPMVKSSRSWAEARRAKHTTEDDSDDDTLRTSVRVHAFPGAVVASPTWAMADRLADLRRAVPRCGVAAADQRLYASAAGRLELVKDDGQLLGLQYVWLRTVAARCTCGRRVRAAQRQLMTATAPSSAARAARRPLPRVRQQRAHGSAQYQTLRKLAADAKTSVDACRARSASGGPEIDGLATARPEPAGARVPSTEARVRPRRRSGCWPSCDSCE